MYYGGFTWSEARQIPVNEREWFRQEIKKELERNNGKENKDDVPLSEQEKAHLKARMANQNPEIARHQQKNKEGHSETLARHHNTPEIRALQGKQRTNVPSRLMRFGGP